MRLDSGPLERGRSIGPLDEHNDAWWMDESWTVESVECGAVEVLMSVGAGLAEQTSWPSSQSSCPSSQESSDLHALTFCKSSSSFWKKCWSLDLNVYRFWKMSIFQSNLFLKSVNRRETRISYNKRVIQVMNRSQHGKKTYGGDSTLS